MKRLYTLLSTVLLLCFFSAGFADTTKVFTPSIDPSGLAAFPVMEAGRIKPLDSYARNILLQFSGRTSYQKESALKWFTRFLINPYSTRDDAIFLINHPEVLNALELKLPEKRRYSLTELEPGLANLSKLIQDIDKIEPKKRNTVEAEIYRVFQNISLYINHFPSLRYLEPAPDLVINDSILAKQLGLQPNTANSFFDILPRLHLIAPFLEGIAQGTGPTSPTEHEALRLSRAMYSRSSTYRDLPFLIIPPHDPKTEVWLSPWDALHRLSAGDSNLDLIANWKALRDAWYQDQPSVFAAQASKLTGQSQKKLTGSVTPAKLRTEVFYNKLNAFLWGKWLYLLSALCFLLGSLWWAKSMRLSGSALMYIAFGLHTFGMISRMWVMGRPPVTNLYETFLFVGWICVVLGIFLERIQRSGLGNLTATLAGLMMLVIAGKYAKEGDTLGMLVAVLDSNFWLSTHVVSITMGYAGCVAAGVVGHFYLWQWFRKSDREVLNKTNRAALGILGFGIVLSFIGTVLGGIWADQSWGRFWGWDPKENGALLIVLWSAILFHARWDGMIREFGLAMGCVFGTLVVAFAWFGVNLLGVGLHSYGFTSGIFINLMIFVGVELSFMLWMALVYWKRHSIKAVK